MTHEALGNFSIGAVLTPRGTPGRFPLMALLVLILCPFLGGCFFLPYVTLESVPQERMQWVLVIDQETQQPIKDARVTCTIYRQQGRSSGSLEPWREGDDEFSSRIWSNAPVSDVIVAKSVGPGQFHIPSTTYLVGAALAWITPLGKVAMRTWHAASIAVEAPGYIPGIAARGTAGGRITLYDPVGQRYDGVIVVPMQRVPETGAPVRALWKPSATPPPFATDPNGPNGWLVKFFSDMPAELVPMPVTPFGPDANSAEAELQRDGERAAWLEKKLLGQPITCAFSSAIVYDRQLRPRLHQLVVRYSCYGVTADGRKFYLFFELPRTDIPAADAPDLESAKNALKRAFAASNSFPVSGTVSNVKPNPGNTDVIGLQLFLDHVVVTPAPRQDVPGN